MSKIIANASWNSVLKIIVFWLVFGLILTTPVAIVCYTTYQIKLIQTEQTKQSTLAPSP